MQAPMLTVPARPVLPTISPDDLRCLPPDAYYKLVQRQVLLGHYAQKLELIIKEATDNKQ